MYELDKVKHYFTMRGACPAGIEKLTDCFNAEQLAILKPNPQVWRSLIDKPTNTVELLVLLGAAFPQVMVRSVCNVLQVNINILPDNTIEFTNVPYLYYSDFKHIQFYYNKYLSKGYTYKNINIAFICFNLMDSVTFRQLWQDNYQTIGNIADILHKLFPNPYDVLRVEIFGAANHFDFSSALTSLVKSYLYFQIKSGVSIHNLDDKLCILMRRENAHLLDLKQQWTIKDNMPALELKPLKQVEQKAFSVGIFRTDPIEKWNLSTIERDFWLALQKEDIHE